MSWLKSTALVISALSALCLIAVLALPILGPSAVVTTRFATLSAAREAGAIERGWLPPVLPHSAREIVEQNDLDVNVGEGEFRYDATERPEYLERLRQAGGEVRTVIGADEVILLRETTRWTISLPHAGGHGRYRVGSKGGG